MNVVIHRRSVDDAKISSDYVLNKLLENDDYGTVVSKHGGSHLHVGSDVDIFFYFGGIYRMDGVRPDYYNADTCGANDFLFSRAPYCRLENLDDVIEVIRNHFERSKNGSI